MDNSVKELMEVLRTLRGPGGCPWDQKQTHESLVKYLREESEEVCTEIEKGNLGESLKEELGDLFLQVMLHCMLAEERGAFSFSEMSRALKEKLIFRHPHVYGENAGPITEEQLDVQWAKLKKIEKSRVKA